MKLRNILFALGMVVLIPSVSSCGKFKTVDQEIKVSYEAGEHGSIVGESEQKIAYWNSTTEVQAVPDDGYTFIQWEHELVKNENAPQSETIEYKDPNELYTNRVDSFNSIAYSEYKFKAIFKSAEYSKISITGGQYATISYVDPEGVDHPGKQNLDISLGPKDSIAGYKFTLNINENKPKYIYFKGWNITGLNCDAQTLEKYKKNTNTTFEIKDEYITEKIKFTALWARSDYTFSVKYQIEGDIINDPNDPICEWTDQSKTNGDFDPNDPTTISQHITNGETTDTNTFTLNVKDGYTVTWYANKVDSSHILPAAGGGIFELVNDYSILAHYSPTLGSSDLTCIAVIRTNQYSIEFILPDGLEDRATIIKSSNFADSYPYGTEITEANLKRAIVNFDKDPEIYKKFLGWNVYNKKSYEILPTDQPDAFIPKGEPTKSKSSLSYNDTWTNAKVPNAFSPIIVKGNLTYEAAFEDVVTVKVETAFTNGNTVDITKTDCGEIMCDGISSNNFGIDINATEEVPNYTAVAKQGYSFKGWYIANLYETNFSSFHLLRSGGFIENINRYQPNPTNPVAVETDTLNKTKIEGYFTDASLSNFGTYSKPYTITAIFEKDDAIISTFSIKGQSIVNSGKTVSNIRAELVSLPGSEPEITWTSSDTNIATVSYTTSSQQTPTITAGTTLGTAIITATAKVWADNLCYTRVATHELKVIGASDLIDIIRPVDGYSFNMLGGRMGPSSSLIYVPEREFMIDESFLTQAEIDAMKSESYDFRNDFTFQLCRKTSRTERTIDVVESDQSLLVGTAAKPDSGAISFVKIPNTTKFKIKISQPAFVFDSTYDLVGVGELILKITYKSITTAINFYRCIESLPTFLSDEGPTVTTLTNTTYIKSGIIPEYLEPYIETYKWTNTFITDGATISEISHPLGDEVTDKYLNFKLSIDDTSIDTYFNLTCTVKFKSDNPFGITVPKQIDFYFKQLGVAV